ncbi:hypothetical protein PS3A_37610 [Pseudomonas sp. 3A(2025)]
MLRHPVGLPVQLGIDQRLALIHRRHSFWPRACLQLDPLMNAQALRIIRLRFVKPFQHLLALCRRQHRQAVDRLPCTLLQCIDQLFHCTHDIITDPLPVGLRAGQQAQAEITAQVVDAERQRKIGALLAAQGFDTLPGGQGLGAGGVLAAAGAVPIVEQRTE